MADNLISVERFKLYADSFTENTLAFSQDIRQHVSTLWASLPAQVELLKVHTTETLNQLQTTTSSPSFNPWIVLGTALASYLLLVQLLRFRNLRKLNKKYSAYLQDPYSMSYTTAHKILTQIMLTETPFMYAFSTQWALIKTYAVAPGTSLLVATRQLVSPTTVGRRAEDTGVILTEFLIGGLDSPRGLTALSKMNWLHRRYGNKIKQPEMLHTLAMFVLEPFRWIERWEWRPLTKMEKVAVYVYWKEIGSRMGIEYIPETLEELEDWVTEYEKENIYFSNNNKLCSDATIGLFLRDLPGWMRGFAHKAVVTFLETHVRVALGYERSPRWIEILVDTGFRARAGLIRHFYLPRWRDIDALPKSDKKGRLHRKLWAFEPWYVEDTFWEWLKAWYFTKGRVVPGEKYKSKGFLVEELGPVEYEKSSREGVLKEADQMKEYASKGGAVGMGCPFKFSI
jgi:hypothetical protein